MRRISATDVSLSSIERPRCGRCRCRMILAYIASLPNEAEKRTFECPKCALTETQTVDDPLRSEALNRLTANIRPPS
jgi:hypothetical protein